MAGQYQIVSLKFLKTLAGPGVYYTVSNEPIVTHPNLNGPTIIPLKVHKIEIYFGFDFEICIISLLVMSKY